MAGRFNLFQLNTNLRRHPNRNKKAATTPINKSTSGVKGKMENFEKEITIIGQSEPAHKSEADAWADALKQMGEHIPDTQEYGRQPQPNEYEAQAAASQTAEPEESTQQTVTQEASLKATSQLDDVQLAEVQDDFLLARIDEFREKAQQLQQLLRTKEEKAEELQQIVNERSDKAEELQQIVNERQEKADGITAEVAKQINNMADKVDAKLDALDQSMARMQRASEAAANTRAQETNRAILQITEQFGEVKQVSDKLDEMKNELSDKLDTTKDTISSKLDETKNELVEKHDTAKSELSDKIHTESVQSYRNTQELIKNIDNHLNKMDDLDKKISSTKSLSTTIVVLTILDILGVAAAVVLSLGIF